MLKKYRSMGKVLLTAIIAILLMTGFIACTKKEEEPAPEKEKKEVVCTEHKYGSWQVTKEATCTSAGERIRVCSVCKDEETENFYAPHTLTATPAKEATCTEAGNTAYWTCSVCKKVFSDNSGNRETTKERTVVAAKGHTLTKHAAAESTCSQEGNTEYYSCSVCNKNFSDDKGANEVTTISTPKKAHTLQKVDGREPDCDETGIKAHYACTVCHETFEDEQGSKKIADVILPIKHGTLEAYAAVESTCTQEGNIAYWICPDCHRYFSDDKAQSEIANKIVVSPMKPHELEHHAAKANSCMEDGNVEYWGCKHCALKYSDAESENVINDVIIPKYSHDMTYHPAVESTCAKQGNVAYFECSLCEKSYADKDGVRQLESVSLQKKAHDIAEIDSTVLACVGGVSYYYCKACAATFSDEAGKIPFTVEETNHTMTHHAGTAATCEAAGTREYWECSVCNKKYIDEGGVAILASQYETLPELGHNYEYKQKVDATCTGQGIQEHMYCSRCDKYFTIEMVETDQSAILIAALGHINESIPAVAATCTENGSENGVKCSRCGVVLTEPFVVAMLGHDYVDGTCTRCEDHKSIRISYQGADEYLETTTDIRANEAFSLPVPQRTSGESYFVGWAFSTTMVTSDQGKSIIPWNFNDYDDTTLTAVWDYPDKRNCVKVQYRGDSDAQNPNLTLHKKGYALPLVSLSGREGYTFNCWKIADSPVTAVTADLAVTVVAFWDKNNYTITFNPQGGSAVATKTIEYLGEIDVSTFTKPTQDQKSFLGWYLNVNDEQPFNWTQMQARNIVLYAKWTEYRIVSVEYDSLTAIKVSDELNKDLFNVRMKDTDGSEVAESIIVEKIEGKKEGGNTISVKLTIVGKYSKKKIITVNGIKVYGAPTLTIEKDTTEQPTFSVYNISQDLTGTLAGARGKDSFGEDTVVIIYGSHSVITENQVKYADLTEEQKAQTVAVGTNGTALLYKEGAGGYALIRTVRTYSEEKEYIYTADGKKILYDVFDNSSAIYDQDVYGYTLVKKVKEYNAGESDFVSYVTYALTYDFGGADPTENFIVKSIDVVGNVTQEVITGVKVYDLPVITLTNEKLAITANVDVTADIWGATAKDSFNQPLTPSFEVGGTKEVGNVLTVTFTAEDSQHNVATKVLKVKVLGTPTLERPEKTRFAVGQLINVETVGMKAKDSVGDVIDDITMVKKDEDAPMTAGSQVVYIVTAKDIAQNTVAEEITVKIYGDPIIDVPETIAVSLTANITDPVSFGVKAVDDFGKELTVVVAVVSGEVVKGQDVTFSFTASNVAGKTKTVTKACPVYAQDDIEFTSLSSGMSDVVKVKSNGSEFGAVAKGTNDSACTITALDVNGNALVAGTTTDIILRAIDAAGNYLDSDVIQNKKVYDTPVVTFNKHNGETYLTAAEYTAYHDGDLTFAAMFTALDSFGEEKDLSFDVIRQTETDSVVTSITVSVISDADAAGNVFTGEYTIDVLAADQSILVLSVGGVEQDTTYRVTKAANVTLPHEYTGYTFNGWKLGSQSVAGANGVVENWPNDAAIYTLIADVTPKTYTIQKMVDGKSIGTQTVTYGESFTIPAPSINAAQRFIGWTLDGEQITGTNGDSLAVWSTVSNSVIPVSADMQTIQSVVELYDAGGRLLGTATLLYGETFKLSTFDLGSNGYDFGGWYLDGAAITDKNGVSLSRWTRTGEKYVLTARRNMVSYTITYYLNGGINDYKNPSEYSASTVGSGLALSDPLKESVGGVTYAIDYEHGGYIVTSSYTVYEFDGWYSESGFVNRVRTITVETGNIELYAKWITREETTETTVSYIVNDDGTVSLGLYPQTRVTDEDLITELETAISSLPSAGNNNGWTLYDYYISGNTDTHFMWYRDYTVVGENPAKYRGVYFTTYRPNATTDSSSADKSYQDDNGYEPGVIYWFKFEPIIWKVLKTADGKAFLYSDVILDARQIDEDASTYLGSSIDSWLTYSFLTTALYERYSEDICDTEITSGNNRKVFLLSKEELCDAELGFSGSEGATDVARRQQVSAYAACLGAYIEGGSGYEGNGSWWTRSSANVDGSRFYMVGYNGTITPESAQKAYYGIVPAINVQSALLYQLNEGGTSYSVIGYNGFEKDITIPAEYDGKPVTAIGKHAFRGKDVASITLADTITTIEAYAFYDCTSLTAVILNFETSSLTTIGECAFYGCTSLVGVVLPEALVSIENNAFKGCIRLTEVVNKSALPVEKGESTNGYVAFYAEDVTVATSFLTVANGFALYEKTVVKLVACYENETNVTVPGSVQEIGKLAFMGCDAIEKLTFGDSLSYIDASSFADMTALTSVTFAELGENTNWYYVNDEAKARQEKDGVVVDVTDKAAIADKLKEGGYFYKKTVTP